MSRLEERLECGLERLASFGHFFFWIFACWLLLVLAEIGGVRTPLRFINTGLEDAYHSLAYASVFGSALVVVTLCAVRLTFVEWWDKRFGD